MSIFQLVVLGGFVLVVLIGVFVFATRGGVGGSGGIGKVVIWGTADQTMMDMTLSTLRQADKSFNDVSYVEKKPETYKADVINAMASGSGPDLVLLAQDDILSFANKLTIIPYSALSQQTFTNSFVEESRLFLTSGGELALPFILDPMVLYWNRDILSSAGVGAPPTTWSGFLDFAPRVTQLDANNNVKISAVALGEWNNVRYAKDILAMLMLQAGDPIVTRDGAGGLMSAIEQTPQGMTQNPAASALQFYTEFANPSKSVYSWNRGLRDSQDAFVAGELGVYLGRASDATVIAGRNPNLRLGVAMMPQVSGSTLRMTYGALTGLAISRTSQNQAGAFAIAQKLTSREGISALAVVSPLPPVRTDVTTDTSNNAAAAVFNQSALIARAWYDPSPEATNPIFQSMIESVVTGKAGPSDAIGSAALSLSELFSPTPQ